MGIVEQPEQGSQSRTAAGIRELLELTDGLLEEGSRKTLSAGLRRLEAGQFNLVVLGEFKRGKSSRSRSASRCSGRRASAAPR
jgi:hypothetical protein